MYNAGGDARGMEELIRDFLSQKRFAVAGSFRDETKYAYRILKTLRGKGYEAYPVNPGIGEVEGQRCYPGVKDIPRPVDVVTLVTPPAVTERIVAEWKELGITKIWLQPGAESDAAIRFCRDNGMDVVYQVCIMMKAV